MLLKASSVESWPSILVNRVFISSFSFETRSCWCVLLNSMSSSPWPLLSSSQKDTSQHWRYCASPDFGVARGKFPEPAQTWRFCPKGICASCMENSKSWRGMIADTLLKSIWMVLFFRWRENEGMILCLVNGFWIDRNLTRRLILDLLVLRMKLRAGVSLNNLQ